MPNKDGFLDCIKIPVKIKEKSAAQYKPSKAMSFHKGARRVSRWGIASCQGHGGKNREKPLGTYETHQDD